MAELEIASIVWHEAGDRVELIYVEGHSEQLIGARHVVAELAENVGLVSAPGPPGTVRWVRGPSDATK